MKVRVGLYILLILFLLISGKEEARAGRYAAKGDTCRVSDRMNQPETWSKIYQWVMDDPQVPDKEDVLMLIRYHFGNFEKLRKLLRYLDGGRPYAYLSEHQFRKIERTGKMKDSLPVAALTLPANTLPEEQLETIAFAPWLEVESKRETPHRTVLALKNNILYDLALAPNVEVELPVGQRWSLNMEYKCPWWSNSKHGFCYQLLSGGVEARCWLGKRKNRERLTGHFLGIYAEGGVYDFQFDKGKGYRGNYYAASGLTYGYSHQLARHLALEFSLGIGYLATEYRKYTTYEGDLIWTSSGRYHFMGPTKAKISLVWLIKGRRR